MNDNERSLPRGAAAGAKDGWSVGTSVVAAALRIAERIALAMERSQQRRALLGLSEHQLRDIGLTRGEVMRGTAKPARRDDAPAGEGRPAVIHDDLSRAA
jgi:uncharacterized protein YjiS (DUF1127 family)